MSDKPIRIIFHLDGTGVLYDLNEPTHLDGILSWCLCAYHVSGETPRRDEAPADIPLPLRRWRIGEHWGWHASALFPEGDMAHGLQRWRSRFREDRAELTVGSPNMSNGTYRDWQMPMPLLLCRRMIAYAHGDRSTVQKILRRGVRYIGKKAAMGKGRVLAIDVEWIDSDCSLVKDGKAMRWLPDEGGTRRVRTRPPYWNSIGATTCCEVGNPYRIET